MQLVGQPLHEAPGLVLFCFSPLFSADERSRACNYGEDSGHKDIETTMIYTHQTDEHLKKSIGKIDTE